MFHVKRVFSATANPAHGTVEQLVVTEQLLLACPLISSWSTAVAAGIWHAGQLRPLTTRQPCCRTVGI